ncbi:biopolymer transporter ExbD [Oscillatoriales cyanobacterium LEGE 11467]|uniref:Biopolymer transporter ExbD n=1 Tax=Zarconia navalis LEGE 11467 TaxID=1828826 RepID=A0A928VWF4_9CYAN|nr:biopolymer transporter ExbD [Zarconia navalis]MBE9039403.1 biopolymer transporter ExbD [Zarconia navalis LEGE 11467]
MRSQQAKSKIPQVNLVPMIDVLMSVLTFFIILAMNLTSSTVPNVDVPTLTEGVTEGTDGAGGIAEEKNEPPEALVVGLDKDGQIILDGGPADEAQLAEAMEIFLAENAEGVVKLTADRELNFRNVDGLLETMAEIGGDRVLLVVQ